MELYWVKCTNGLWCPLQNVDLEKVDTQGVYVIWHSGNPARVVYVGQGDIKDRLTKHRREQEILYYGAYGELLVTWASVPWNLQDGVERYLADAWHPLVGESYPDALPIAVNSPWS